MNENVDNASVDAYIRDGKKIQVIELLESNLRSVFAGSIPETVMKKIANEIDKIYNGE